MPSRKRVKGKLRKAKSVARAVCTGESTWLNWLLWGTRMKGIQCSHGAVTPSSSNISNKDIDLFMSDFVDSIRQDVELSSLMRELLIRHPTVFNDGGQLKIIISNMLAMGTNDILRDKIDRRMGTDNACILACSVLILENYAKTNDINAPYTWHTPRNETLMMVGKGKRCDSSVRGSVVRVWILCMLKLNQSKGKLGGVTDVKRHSRDQLLKYVTDVESVSIAVWIVNVSIGHCIKETVVVGQSAVLGVLTMALS